MRKLTVFFVLALCFCAGVSAQNAILPDHFGAWEAQGPTKTLGPKDLQPNWIQTANGPQILQECGLKTIEERSYRSGQDDLTLRVFQLGDPSGAYELYTLLLTPSMHNFDLGTEAAADDANARVLVGNYVVDAAFGAHTKPESLSALASMLNSRADSSPLPPVKSYLPVQWRVSGTEKYALGAEGFRAGMSALGQGAYADLAQEVGFNRDSPEAMFAKYQGQHGSGTLLLLEYPTPQVAENRKHHLQQALQSLKQSGITVERKASLLSLVFDATSEMHAQAIRDEVNYDTSVTWDEPHQSYSDPPLVRVLYKIFLFTSLFLVVATMTGIAFGGFRILVKHWWPGKIFDRPENIEVIQLGLSGKKIDPSDMY